MASYPFPDWIRPPDIAGEYARGLAIGQQAAQESQRLQMQQEENQRAHLMEQQRLMVDKAYKDQQLAMQKQELDQATKLNALRIQSAAQALDSQAKYTQHLQSGGPGGTPGDPLEGILKYGRGLGITGPGYAAIVKQYEERQHPFVPRTVVEDGTKFAETSRDHYRVVTPPKVVETELQKFDTSDLKSRLKKATTDLEGIAIDDPKMYDKGSKEGGMLKDFQKKRNLVDMLRNKLANKSTTPQDVAKRAHAAIAAGADEAKVKARYKEVTGQELDAADTTDDGEE